MVEKVTVEKDQKETARLIADDEALRRVIESRQILVFIRSFYNRLTNLENKQRATEEDVTEMQNMIAEMELATAVEASGDNPKSDAEITVVETCYEEKEGSVFDGAAVSCSTGERLGNCGTCLYSEIEEKKRCTHLRCTNHFSKRHQQNVGWSFKCNHWRVMSNANTAKDKFVHEKAVEFEKAKEPIMITSIDIDSGQETVVMEE